MDTWCSFTTFFQYSNSVLFCNFENGLAVLIISRFHSSSLNNTRGERFRDVIYRTIVKCNLVWSNIITAYEPLFIKEWDGIPIDMLFYWISINNINNKMLKLLDKKWTIYIDLFLLPCSKLSSSIFRNLLLILRRLFIYYLSSLFLYSYLPNI